jgi:hypothetical protein
MRHLLRCGRSADHLNRRPSWFCGRPLFSLLSCDGRRSFRQSLVASTCWIGKRCKGFGGKQSWPRVQGLERETYPYSRFDHIFPQKLFIGFTWNLTSGVLVNLALFVILHEPHITKFLGYCALQCLISTPTFQRCILHHQGTMMGAVRSSGTSVYFSEAIRRIIGEGCHLRTTVWIFTLK